MAEKLAENSHDLWALRKKEELEEIGIDDLLCRLRIIAAHRDHFVQRPSVGSHA